MVNANLIAPDDQTRTIIEDFLEFGAPLELPYGLAIIDFDLPGGLGGTETVALRLTPSERDQLLSRVIRLRALDPDHHEISTVRVRTNPVTTGLHGSNLRTTGEADGGAFGFEIRFQDASNQLTVSFTPRDMTGQTPATVLPELRFLDSLKSPNSIQLAPEHGPFIGQPIPVPETFAQLVDKSTLLLVESITAIQETTTTQLRIPDLTELTKGQWEKIVTAAHLLQGEKISVTVPTIEFTSNGTPPPMGDVALFTTAEFSVEIGGAIIPIGLVGFHADRVRITVADNTGQSPELLIVHPVDRDIIAGTLVLMDSDAGRAAR
jgi:hypothetical protein